jgi:HTH-type transcriptional regulator, transcriptional repressor of NAD biosynthesis genes
MTSFASDRPRSGLVIGRFCPPHLGHSHMIEWAEARVEHLVVFVNTRTGEPVPGPLRARWLADLHPTVTVVEVAHDLATDWNDEELWSRWIALFRRCWPVDLGAGPDVLFGSETYTAEIARRLGARAVSVDPDRRAVPISATAVRENPAAHLDRLAAPVRAWVEQMWVHPAPIDTNPH